MVMLVLKVLVTTRPFPKQQMNICLSVCPSVCDSSEESSLGIDHTEEMELLLENYYMQVGLAKILIYCKITFPLNLLKQNYG